MVDEKIRQEEAAARRAERERQQQALLAKQRAEGGNGPNMMTPESGQPGPAQKPREHGLRCQELHRRAPATRTRSTTPRTAAPRRTPYSNVSAVYSSMGSGRRRFATACGASS